MKTVSITDIQKAIEYKTVKVTISGMGFYQEIMAVAERVTGVHDLIDIELYYLGSKIGFLQISVNDTQLYGNLIETIMDKSIVKISVV